VLLRKKLTFKLLISSVIIFFLIFSIFAVILKKGGNSDSSILENFSSILNVIIEYFVGGIHAFNTKMQFLVGQTEGHFTFRFIRSLLGKIGFLDYHEISLIEPFVKKPIFTNVYTIYSRYLSDFSFNGLIILFIIGFIQTYIFIKAKFNSVFYVLLYSILLYPLLLSGFHEQYFTILATWIQYIFFGFIFTFLIKIKPAIKFQ
jgi:oligosaccharide repeat unit polymerase